MKSFRYAFLLAAAFLLTLPASAQQHFDQCISRTAENATLIIPASIQPTVNGEPLEAGDEIAVITPDGTCAGVTVWDGATTAISAWGADEYSGVGGFAHGDTLRFAVWDASAGVEYQDIVVSYSDRATYVRTDGVYVGGAIYELAALFTTSSAPQPAAPADGASLGSTDVVLEWYPVLHAESYVLQVAPTADFSQLTVDERALADTTFALEALSSGTYYWRVGVTVGDEVLFSTPRHFIVASVHKVVLEPGWNLISSYVRPSSNGLSELIAPLGSNVVLVKDERANVYLPGFATDQIGTWESEQGYKIYVHEQDTLTVTGSLLSPEETPVVLRAGWNYISYLPQVEMATAGALAGVEQHLVLAKDIDGRVFYPEFGIENLETLKPGRGYAAYAREATTLVYPANASSSGKVLGAKASVAPGSTQDAAVAAADTDSSGIGYSAHIIVEEPTLEKGEVISVWSGDVLVGQGVVQDSTALILVQGDDPLTSDVVEGASADQPLELRAGATRQGQRMDVAAITDVLTGRDRSGLAFTEDAVWKVALSTSTGWSDPAELADFVLEQNYPNPFRQTTTIGYALERSGHVQLEVFNLIGQRVKVLVSETQRAGQHDVSFDARSLPSGTYMYRIEADGQIQTRSMIVLK